MRRFALTFVVIVLATLTASAQEFVRVKRVIDGDTIVLENGERVQLLGVNAPSTKNPDKQVAAFGKEAFDFTKGLVEGKLVRLEFDPFANRNERRSRTLAYVFLQDGRHLNAEIIRFGHGLAVSRFPPLKYDYEFRKLEGEAREKRRGIWSFAAKGQT